MKMPTELKIGSRMIPVKMVAMDKGLMGQYDPHTQSISINKSMPASQQMETVMHEAVHAIHDYVGTQAAIANEIAASQADGANPDNRAFNLEEYMTNGFANAFMAMMKDNNMMGMMGAMK